MPTIVLSRALTYLYRSLDDGRQITFRRGQPVAVAQRDYEELLARGGFIDPGRQLDFVNPPSLRRAPKGTTVPIFRTGGLGDVLMVTIPLVDLPAAWPDLRFVYVTSHGLLPLMRDLPAHGVQPVSADQIQGRFPFAIDLRGFAERLGREQAFRIDVFAHQLLGRRPRSYDFPLRGRPEEAERGTDLLGRPGRPVLALVIGSSPGDRWWPQVYVEELTERAVDAGFAVALLHDRPYGVSDRLRRAGAIDLTGGRLSIHELACVVQASAVVVGPDTGTLHLAEALDTRAVAYYTTVEPDARCRGYTWTRALWAGLPCSPCYHRCCGDWSGGAHPCAWAVGVNAVWKEIEFVLARDPPWPTEAEFDPVPVVFPSKAPLKPDARNRQAAMMEIG